MALFGCTAEEKPQAPPNILFLMSDGRAIRAISAYGGRINATPNIDRLAK